MFLVLAHILHIFILFSRITAQVLYHLGLLISLKLISITESKSQGQSLILKMALKRFCLFCLDIKMQKIISANINFQYQLK